MFSFVITETNDQMEVKLIGDFDIDCTEIIEQEILPIAMRFSSININFQEVEFIDSSGIGLLLTVVQSLREKEKQVTITNIKEDVMTIFELLQVPAIVGEGVFDGVS